MRLKLLVHLLLLAGLRLGGMHPLAGIGVLDQLLPFAARTLCHQWWSLQILQVLQNTAIYNSN